MPLLLSPRSRRIKSCMAGYQYDQDMGDPELCSKAVAEHANLHCQKRLPCCVHAATHRRTQHTVRAPHAAGM